jgi:hypothetical protein
VRLPLVSWVAPAATPAAAIVFAASAALAAWSYADRARARGRGGDPVAAAAAAEAEPSAAAYRRLSLARLGAGDAEGAAAAALTAARLAPKDARAAAAADAALDAAMRARAARGARPWLLASAAWLAVAGARAALAARERRRVGDALRRARGRVVPACEGEGAATGVAGPETAGIVLDVHLGAALGDLRGKPPVVVVLSHSGASRAVRLSPVSDYSGSALRVRLSDSARGEVLAHPGRWRLLARAGGETVAEGVLEVRGRRAGPALAAAYVPLGAPAA